MEKAKYRDAAASTEAKVTRRFSSETKTDLKTNNIEGVKGEDLSRAVPGEVLGVGETEHDDEQVASVRQEGGQLSKKASGGEAVWKESLMPEEKALLKRYFK